MSKSKSSFREVYRACMQIMPLAHEIKVIQRGNGARGRDLFFGLLKCSFFYLKTRKIDWMSGEFAFIQYFEIVPLWIPSIVS